MAFYAKVRKTDQLIAGTTVLTEAQAVKWPADADERLQEITEEQYAVTRPGLFHHGSGIPKFRWTQAGFVNNPDTRPVVTFTPSEIKAEVGEAVTVEINHSRAGTELLEFSLAGVPTRIDFAAGKATVSVDTSSPGQFLINSMEDFQVTTPLQVTVFTRKLGRKQ